MMRVMFDTLRDNDSSFSGSLGSSKSGRSVRSRSEKEEELGKSTVTTNQVSLSKGDKIEEKVEFWSRIVARLVRSSVRPNR